MAKIITVAHQKGGVGKSTLSLNLAYRLTKQMKTALTDIDLQGTTMRIQGVADELEIVDYSNIAELRKSAYDVVVIDTPPYLISTMLPIFSQSDFILVPTKAGVPDILAIADTVELIKQAQISNPNLKCGIVLNMVKSRAGITAQAKAQLIKFGLPILSEIKDRTAYGSTFLKGGVFNGTDKLAQGEIETLTNEILSYL